MRLLANRSFVLGALFVAICGLCLHLALPHHSHGKDFVFSTSQECQSEHCEDCEDGDAVCSNCFSVYLKGESANECKNTLVLAFLPPRLEVLNLEYKAQKEYIPKKFVVPKFAPCEFFSLRAPPIL